MSHIQKDHIDYIEMPSTDLPQTKQFFEQLFGWQFTNYGPDYCDFSDTKISGGFYKSDKHMSSDNGSALVVFFSDDLDASYQRVVSAGGRIVKETFEFPGGKRFHFAEPGGNEYAIWAKN